MILPQLEQDIHGVDVIGMMFFDDNIFALRKNDPVGERLSKIAKEKICSSWFATNVLFAEI